jgi:hypothetical protein
VAADWWSGPALWMSMILYKGDIRSHVSDCAPASAQDFLGWLKAAMSPFYPESDPAGTPVPFSPSVRKRRGWQAGRDVLRQDTAVRRYVPRVICTAFAQKSARFSRMARDVLAHLQVAALGRLSTFSLAVRTSCSWTSFYKGP